MRQCDLLVLPSLFDGWGAVVNEALQAGMRVLCSTACGAASLLDGRQRGGSFDPDRPESLRRALPQGSPVPTLPRSDAVVLAQPELLCDMLYNLIQNARKATPADGKVEVLLDETPTRLTIRVQDTGCGIPPQELARITEPFYMVDKSRAREQGGSGMGLALCARIAALHGTTLQFASVPSQGTTVSFCLQKAGSQPEVEP